jgi:hypothetical protein
VPAKSEEPNITLDEGGSALRAEWKLPKKLFTATQATVQSIPVDSAWYNRYCNTQDQMKAARVHPIEGCNRSVPQVVNLEHECTGVPKTLRFDVPTALSPFSQTRDAARRVRMCKSESKKRFENGCGSKVVEFSLNENYEH